MGRESLLYLRSDSPRRDCLKSRAVMSWRTRISGEIPGGDKFALEKSSHVTLTFLSEGAFSSIVAAPVKSHVMRQEIQSLKKSKLFNYINLILKYYIITLTPVRII
jgi:hypothetical protein